MGALFKKCLQVIQKCAELPKLHVTLCQVFILNEVFMKNKISEINKYNDLYIYNMYIIFT